MIRMTLSMLALLACGASQARADAVGCPASLNGSALASAYLDEGKYDPPAHPHPDDTSGDTAVWGNLNLADQPLSVVCTYADGSTSQYLLPSTTTQCVLTKGTQMTMTCQ